MASEIKMPQLSDTMNSGKILTWHKKVGDVVKRGDILAEVETDKANLEIESFQDGTLLEIKAQANSTANVGEVICVLGKPGEQVSTNGSATPAPVKAAPEPAQAAIPTPAPSVTTPQAAAPQYQGDRIIASPLARKIAAERSVDLSTVSGTGPNGRIVKKDIESAATSSSQSHSTSAPRQEAKAPVEAPRREPIPSGGRSTPLSKMRDTIARRMQQSVTEAPHFYVTTAVRMEQAFKLREFLKHKPEYKGLSVNHLVIKAVAYALQEEPRVNAAYRDGALYEPSSINIGIITAIPDGLLIPVIRDANTLSLKDLVFEAKAAVERAKAGRPSSTDLTGGTFSISNMGMFDVESFTAIINPGQGGVLAVSATKEVPVVENGAVVPGQVMKATVSVDHRVIDGIMAAQFLKHFKDALEQPALLMGS